MFKKLVWILPVGVWVGCNNGPHEQAAVAEGISLVHKAKKGETYTIHLEWDEKISSTDSTGNTQLQEIKHENVMEHTVLEVDENGTATITGKYVSVKIGDFDSRDSSTYKDTAMAAMYMEMARKQIVMRIDTLGNVLGVTGAEGLFSMGIKDSPLDDNRIMRETVQNSIGIFPGKKVRKGDSWEKKNTISYGYPGIYQHTYTLEEVKDGIATIEVKSVIEPNLTAPPTYFPGNVMVRMELMGTQSGTIEVDINRGRIVKTDITLRVSGKAHGVMNGKRFENIISTELNTKAETRMKTQQP